MSLYANEFHIKFSISITCSLYQTLADDAFHSFFLSFIWFVIWFYCDGFCHVSFFHIWVSLHKWLALMKSFWNAQLPRAMCMCVHRYYTIIVDNHFYSSPPLRHFILSSIDSLMNNKKCGEYVANEKNWHRNSIEIQ